MSPSDGRRRAAGESAATAEPEIETAAAVAADNGSDEATDAGQRDPWFAPGPKRTERGAGAAGDTAAGWFLPAGRAGLAPDSMTVAPEDEDGIAGSAYRQATISGAPPWAEESVGPVPAAPPPWENGPWPGPRSAGGQEVGWNDAGGSGGSPQGTGQPPQGGLWSPRVILIAGLVPLVVPGLVLGTLGLGRSSAGEPTRRASLGAIYTSLIWAVVIAVIVVVSSSGTSAGTCTYPAAVHRAYARALSDLDGPAPASILAADLSTAVSAANASAAATGQIAVRSALLSMASDLEQARTDVAAGKAVPAVLRQQLAADGTSLSRACQG